MTWLCLVLAGCFEIGWPIGLKLGWTDAGAQPRWIAFAVVAMAISGGLLLAAQRSIPIGTAYAVWTGIGAVGTFIAGIYLFGDSTAMVRWIGVALIAGGIVTLKLA